MKLFGGIMIGIDSVGIIEATCLFASWSFTGVGLVVFPIAASVSATVNFMVAAPNGRTEKKGYQNTYIFSQKTVEEFREKILKSFEDKKINQDKLATFTASIFEYSFTSKEVHAKSCWPSYFI